MFCSKCGKEIPDGSVFCAKCGAKVMVVEKDACEKKIEKDTKVSEEVSNVKKQEPKKLFVGVVIAVVVIALLKVVFGGIGTGSGISFAKYKESEDLKVVGSLRTADNYIVVNVENVSEKTIRDYEVAYVGFDASGNAIKLDGDNWYKVGRIQSANILPGDTYGLDNSFYYSNDAISYVRAVVSNITFMDGTTWEADNIASWANDAKKSFSVDEYKNEVENMKALSMQAEANPYVKVVSLDKYDDNRFSGSDDLDVAYENVGTQDIRNIRAIVMQYDANGYAIDVSPGVYITSNCQSIQFSNANLVAGGICKGNYSLFFDDNCERFRLLVTEVEFMDGTKWINKNTFQWIVYNENERKN